MNQALIRADQLIQESALILKKNDTLNIDQLHLNEDDHLYVYRKEELLFWSNTSLVPQRRDLPRSDPFRLYETNTGTYLVYWSSHSGYDIFYLLPLAVRYEVENDYLQASANPIIFPIRTVQLFSTRQGESLPVIHSSGTYLFSFIPNIHEWHDQDKYSDIVLLVFLIGLFLAVSFLIKLIYYQAYKGRFEQGLVVLLLAMLLFFVLNRVFNLPERFILSPEWLYFYRFPWGTYTLGSILPTSLGMFLIVFYVFRFFFYSKLYRQLLTAGFLLEWFIPLVLLLTTFILVALGYHLFYALSLGHAYSLDLYQDIHFTTAKWFSFVVFLTYSATYFTWVHICVKVTSRLLYVDKYVIPLLLFSAVLSILFVHKTDFFVLSLFGGHLLYVLSIYLFRLAEGLGNLKYRHFIYFLISGCFSAILGATAFYQRAQDEMENSKKSFAKQTLLENDQSAEHVLANAADQIRNDIFIKNRLIAAVGRKELIEQRVKRIYLSTYFDRYDIQVSVFDAQGIPFLDDEGMSYNELRKRYGESKYATEYPNLVFIKGTGPSLPNRYLYFIDVNRFGTNVGHIVLNLKLKRVVPHSVYPELLLDKRYASKDEFKDLSYAVFENGTLSYSSGDFNYARNFPFLLLQNDFLYRRGINVEGYSHLGIEGEETTKQIVVSSVIYHPRHVLTNVASLFLLQAVGLLFSILAFSGFLGIQRRSLTYATRIQIYLNLAIFIPLFVISVSMVSIIASTYSEDTRNNYVSKAENIARNLAEDLQAWRSDDYSREQFYSRLNQLSKYTEADINIYTMQGQLLASSQPLIYENHLRAEYINPYALMEIKGHAVKSVLMNELVGKLRFKSVYIVLKSPETGDELAILGVPFFDSRRDLEAQLIKVISNVIGIFTIVFIGFLIISYFASRSLTFPLRFITNTLRKTDFDQKTTPLIWKNNDELGLMLSEYNRMMANLEASRRALSRSEKETAWREMAKQVAHEIKNPLTPMKLGLQHLERMIKEGRVFEPPQLEQPVQSLLHQVEILDDIASSFPLCQNAYPGEQAL
ncbi:MAG: hypothetical protein HC842_00845 [Cytophagales bacterium]|nr:hypothetical protein [Cytophagales bacterium]